MKHFLCGVAVAGVASLALLVSAPAGWARPGQEDRTHSFEGNCSVEGPVTFDPPATDQQQRLDVDYTATGTCSGTLDGASVSDAPVTMHNRAVSDGSCLHAQTITPGRGAMRFAGGATVAYTFEFTYVGTDGVLTFNGNRSGSALGHGSFVTPHSSPEAAQGCSDGTGVRQIPMVIQLVTQSPLVSSAHSRQTQR